VGFLQGFQGYYLFVGVTIGGISNQSFSLSSPSIHTLSISLFPFMENLADLPP